MKDRGSKMSALMPAEITTCPRPRERRKQQHQPGNRDGTNGEAPPLLVMYARGETGKYYRCLDPIVTKSVTKLDRTLEGTCIGNFQRIVTTGTIRASLPRLLFNRGCDDGGRL
jgi:hypothetical protein